MTDSKQEKIQQTLLGRLTKDIQIVIITPITSAFNKFNAMLQPTELHKGAFFHNSIFQTKNGVTGMIVRIPQGICSQDVLYAFSGVQVIFYGYAGSLFEDIAIGSILEVENAIDPTGNVFPLESVSTFDTVTCGYSPCLLGDTASRHCEQARSAGCHVVDMEVVYCACAAKINLNHFTAFLVVSDIPYSINFWELDENTKAHFKQKSGATIDYIVSYVNSVN